MSLSWGFSVGNVRAREGLLMKRQELLEFAGLNNEKQLVQELSDKGFGGSAATVEEMAKFETAALWEYVKSTAADFSVFDPFLLDNDYHNLKTVIKGVLSGREYKHLLLSPSVIDIDVLETAVKEKRFHLLPEFCADDASEGYTLLAATGDAQLVDGMLDKSRMKASLESVKKASPLLREYIETKVLFENIKVALRGAKAQKDVDFYNKTLYFPSKVESLKNAALEGSQAVTEWLENFDEQAAINFKKSSTEFEKYADNCLMSVTKKAKLISSGPDVIIGYVFAKLAEIRAVLMLASGIRTEAGETVIAERLRELYD